MTAFVDTSALYALFDQDDENHSRAAAAWRRLLGEEAALLTTNYVLVESAALLQRRLGIAALRALHEDIAPVLRIEWIQEGRHQAGMEAVLAAGKKDLSLVDCVSFQAMREYGIRTAFCFDRHFREQGFESIP